MKTVETTEKKAILDGLMNLFAQNRRWLLFFGTGTSCELDKRFGMEALKEHLGQELAAEPEWARVDAGLKAGKSLEQALDGTGAGLSQATKARFRKVTGNFIAGIDRLSRDPLLMDQTSWVGTRLLKALVGRLPPRNPRLSVITPNYDMLIEYACSAQGIRLTTGFVGGLMRMWDWDAAQDSLLQSHAAGGNPWPRVELFKVHGSINRFIIDGRPVECDLWSEGVPAGVERDLAVPGDLKYEQYAVSNMDTVSRAVRVQDEAQAFVMVGYGFRDRHLHERIATRVRRQNCPLVVLTQDLDDVVIADLRKDGAPVWVLVCPKLSAGGYDLARTLVYRPGMMSPLTLGDVNLWNCDTFAERILGG